MSATRREALLTLPVAAGRDHVAGLADAVVTLVEYGDYECPYCGAAHPIIKEVQARMGERLRFAFRNFPLTTAHPHAQAAAEAAEAAAAQGAFWPMHDLLFENQTRLRERDLRAYAERLGLDLERFDADLTGHVHAARVHEDFLSGVRSGVNGTPTFYINGARHDGSYELESLLPALQRATHGTRREAGGPART
jgi:protein-disulfide isomerase